MTIQPIYGIILNAFSELLLFKCFAEIPGCGSAWLEHLVWDQGVAGSNPVFPTILKPVDQMIYGFCFLSCSLVVVRKIDGVEAGYAWKDEKHPCCGGAAEPAAS